MPWASISSAAARAAAWWPSRSPVRGEARRAWSPARVWRAPLDAAAARRFISTSSPPKRSCPTPTTRRASATFGDVYGDDVVGAAEELRVERLPGRGERVPCRGR